MVCGAWRIVYGALAHLEVEQRVAVAQVVLQPAQHAAQHVRVAVGDELHNSGAEEQVRVRSGCPGKVRCTYFSVDVHFPLGRDGQRRNVDRHVHEAAAQTS